MDHLPDFCQHYHSISRDRDYHSFFRSLFFVKAYVIMLGFLFFFFCKSDGMLTKILLNSNAFNINGQRKKNQLFVRFLFLKTLFNLILSSDL